MSKLVDSLIQHLLLCSPNDKEKIGTTIVKLLSGDTTKKANNLPARRGNADGGIDGRIKIISETIKKMSTSTGIAFERGLKEQQNAAVSVKIEKGKFTPEQFGYFKDALERESIFVGIIITASGLSPDVKQRINDINLEGIYCFYHIFLKDIIMWKVHESGIEFQCGDISKRIREELNNFVSSFSKIEDEKNDNGTR